MTTYFGFLPSSELNSRINDTIDITKNQPDTPFYPLQLEISNKIAHELLDNLFVYLVEIIEDKKRQEKMKRIVTTVNSAVDTMLKHIIIEQPNEIVIDSFHFLIEECLFLDDEGNRRFGFKLTEDEASQIVDNFNVARVADDPNQKVQKAMNVLIRANLTHFLNKFTRTLHLSLVKRKAVPVAESVINKASQMALNKLLPQMPYEANIRLMDHFEQFIVVLED